MNAHSQRGGSKRARILDSALRVFASKGFFGAKVADIAADAGVADGTIYLYFKSKDDLLIKIFEDLMDEVNAALASAIRGGRDASEKLRRFIHAYVNLVERSPHAAEVLTVELRQSAKFMKQGSNPRFADYLKILGTVIDEGQRAGLFRADIPAPIVARALFGLLDELTVLWVASRAEKLDMRKAADWAANLVLQGLEVAPRRAEGSRDSRSGRSTASGEPR